MSLTLYINKSDSHCECSGQSVSFRDLVCPHCGGTWDTLSSDYAAGGIEEVVVKLRPDLEPHFPWADWYNSEDGQRQLKTLRAELQMDTTSQP